MAEEEAEGLRDRLSRQGEEALGKLASDLLENPLINSAITRAFSAREKAAHAQEAAMGALNLPSAADIERLTRLLRTVRSRLEGIEDALDRLEQGVERLTERLDSVSRGAEPALADRIAALERQLARLVADVGGGPVPVPREQERLAVDEAPPKPNAARKRAAKKKA
jgi:septal ring factor EnvC (AmiA/AmiB activator)